MSEINESVLQAEKVAEQVMQRVDLTRATTVETIQLPDGIYVRHGDFVYCNTGGWANRKPWAAQITGYDPKYRFAREFLQRTEVDEIIYQKIPDLPAVIQFHGGSTKNEYKPFYVVFQKDKEVYALEVNERIVLQAITKVEA